MDLRTSSIKNLKDLLPIDDESLGQMVENALSLPSQSAITEYWLGLLGESPDALDFIAKFTSKLTKDSAPKVSHSTSSTSASHTPKHQSIPKSSSQAAGGRSTKNPWNQPTVEKQKLRNKPRLAKNVSSTTSQLLDKPQEKPTKQTAKREKQRKVDNLKDLDEILKQLEISDGINTDEKVVCNCMATRHPLFEAAPNCLNCGKIICVKEGYRPCSFCGSELISSQEKQQIITMLRSEKTQLESPSRTPEPQVSAKTKKKKITVGSGAGVNLWTQQEALFKKLEAEDLQRAEVLKRQKEEEKELKEQNSELEYYNRQKGVDPDLLKAQKNLENLLNFQANSAERTKIIDQASDFEIPAGSNLNMWSSSVEKALQLKKQQKQMRKLEKKQKELTGRGRKVMDMSIGKDGKVVLRERKAEDIDSEDDEADEEIKKLEQDIRNTKDKNSEKAFHSVWDFEKDKAKWIKPVYVGGQDEEASEGTEEKSSKWERIQLAGASENLEELLVGI